MDPSHTYSTRKANTSTTLKHNANNNNSHQYINQLPPFPPPGIVLHPEDATNKVFIAIARAFVSVDNRAMTIKDIAERATAFGLQCQNLSAGSQAVTTYIRAHRARCEREDDAPLLLSHTLSGTPADDDLVPALYSRAGGDSHPLPLPARLTNFRKGTAVWYLGRATGVRCPFERAGIRLCDYALPGAGVCAGGSGNEGASGCGREGGVWREGSREEGGEGVGVARPVRKSLRNRERMEAERCGEKRKRSVRSCGASVKPGEEASDGERPPKVKLTLRLKPLLARVQSAVGKEETPSVVVEPEGSSSARPIDVSKDEDEDEDEYDSSDDEEEEEEEDEESMSVDQDPPQDNLNSKHEEEEKPWSLPPYPRRSISIPCYTPSVETYPHDSDYHRSPSAPYAYEATPPPDSEDEADDFHVAMARIEDYSEDEADDEEEMGDRWDADLDFDSDDEGEASETVFESPGPRSPSAPLLLPTADVAVKVKEEPRDVQGMLDLWEDFDSSVADARVVDVLAKAFDLDLFDSQRGGSGGGGVGLGLGAEGREREKLKVKTEELGDGWIWDTAGAAGEEATARMIKQESDDNFDALFPLSTPGPLSPLSSMTAQFAAFSTGYGYDDHSNSNSSVSESPRPLGAMTEYEEEGRWDARYDTVRPRAKTVPVPMPFFQSQRTTMAGGASASSSSVPPLPLPQPSAMTRAPSQDSTVLHPTARFYHQSMSVNTAAIVSQGAAGGVGGSKAAVSGVGSGSASGSGSLSLAPPTPCVSPLQTRCQQPVSPPSPVVVTTCQPCKPAISATQIEDISVYQMMLGAFQLLRRIDTDFVNLSPIAALAASSTPPLTTSAIPNAILITKGSPQVCGTWVPLGAAQAYVHAHLAEERKRDLEVFLSDELVERFPEALREFHRSGRKAGLVLGGMGLGGLGLGISQFGRHFASTIQAAQLEVQVEGGASASSGSTGIMHQQQQQTMTTTMQPGMFVAGVSVSKHLMEEDVVPPLSASEQQLFHELCVMPDDERAEEEDGMDVDVDVPAPASASTSASAVTDSTPALASTSTQRPAPLDLKVDVSRGASVVLADGEEPMSPLSPLPPSPIVSTSGVQRPMSPLMLSQPLVVAHEATAAAAKAVGGGDGGRPLRRSKRVADATQRHLPAATTASRARARKSASRNSLS